jgi:hypothetical protein
MARAKEGWLLDQLDLIQTYMSPEALKVYGGRYGHDWMDDDVQLFFECDIEKAVRVVYIPGTEVPESRFEKGMRLRADIGAGFIPMTPQLAAQLAKESNFDGIDVDNYDSNMKLADMRYRFLQDTVKTMNLDAMYQQIEMQMTDPQTGMRVSDEQGMPLPNPVIQQLLSAPELQLYPQAENHVQMMDFWSQKVREIAGMSRLASPVLLAACNAMLEQHSSADFQNKLQESGKMGTADAAAQAPAAIGQQMLEQQNAPPSEPPPMPEAEKMDREQSHEVRMKAMDIAGQKSMQKAA